MYLKVLVKADEVKEKIENQLVGIDPLTLASIILEIIVVLIKLYQKCPLLFVKKSIRNSTMAVLKKHGIEDNNSANIIYKEMLRQYKGLSDEEIQDLKNGVL